MLKVGVIGSGWVANNRHIPSFRRDSRVKLIGVASSSLKSAEETARKFGIPHFYDNADELLKQPLDIVDICTPPFVHREMVIKAAEANCHIFVEKPFSLNSEEAEEMIRIARRNNVKLCVSHNFLFSRSMKRARMLHYSKAFGRITGAIALQMTNLKRRLPEWYNKLPGGLFFDESPHMLYSILEFLGDVSVAYACAEKWENSLQPLSCVEASMKSKFDSATAYLRFTFNAPRDEWILAIIGTNRVAIVDFFRDTILEINEGGQHTPTEVLSDSLSLIWKTAFETANSGLRFLSKRLYFGHEELIRRFIDAVENDTESPVPGEKGKLVIELIEQILEMGQSSA
jgi:scyllo-inositol 2-dehydrogenase (NADP+)